MEKRQVWQYKCEFCGKKNYASGAMRKHEERCTKNPTRKCGVCGMIEAEQQPIADLIAVLPDLPADEWGGRVDPKNLLPESTKALRHKANDCPACMMAALRQKGIPLPMLKHRPNGEKDLFNFTKEMASIWSDINESRNDYY